MSWWLEIASALGIGLLGATHCLSMCGSVNALMLGQTQGSPLLRSRRVLAFNLGRIGSYALAGLSLGSVSFAVQSIHPNIMAATQILAGLLLLAMALFIGRWWLGLGAFERWFGRIWQYIQPLATQLLPVKSTFAALKIGALWGWMPCGMVYSTLSWAILAENPLQSAVLMLAFGVGTLPAMLAAGFFAQAVLNLFKLDWVRNLSVVMLIVFALWQLSNGIGRVYSDQSGHQHNHVQNEDKKSPAYAGQNRELIETGV